MPKTPRYSYRVFWSDEDGEFVATCPEAPVFLKLGASALPGPGPATKINLFGWALPTTTDRAIQAPGSPRSWISIGPPLTSL